MTVARDPPAAAASDAQQRTRSAGVRKVPDGMRVALEREVTQLRAVTVSPEGSDSENDGVVEDTEDGQMRIADSFVDAGLRALGVSSDGAVTEPPKRQPRVGGLSAKLLRQLNEGAGADGQSHRGSGVSTTQGPGGEGDQSSGEVNRLKLAIDMVADVINSLQDVIQLVWGDVLTKEPGTRGGSDLRKFSTRMLELQGLPADHELRLEQEDAINVRRLLPYAFRRARRLQAELCAQTERTVLWNSLLGKKDQQLVLVMKREEAQVRMLRAKVRAAAVSARTGQKRKEEEEDGWAKGSRMYNNERLLEIQREQNALMSQFRNTEKQVDTKELEKKLMRAQIQEDKQRIHIERLHKKVRELTEAMGLGGDELARAMDDLTGDTDERIVQLQEKLQDQRRQCRISCIGFLSRVQEIKDVLKGLRATVLTKKKEAKSDAREIEHKVLKDVPRIVSSMVLSEVDLNALEGEPVHENFTDEFYQMEDAEEEGYPSPLALELVRTDLSMRPLLRLCKVDARMRPTKGPPKTERGMMGLTRCMQADIGEVVAVLRQKVRDKFVEGRHEGKLAMWTIDSLKGLAEPKWDVSELKAMCLQAFQLAKPPKQIRQDMLRTFDLFEYAVLSGSKVKPPDGMPVLPPHHSENIAGLGFSRQSSQPLPAGRTRSGSVVNAKTRSTQTDGLPSLKPLPSFRRSPSSVRLAAAPAKPEKKQRQEDEPQEQPQAQAQPAEQPAEQLQQPQQQSQPRRQTAEKQSEPERSSTHLQIPGGGLGRSMSGSALIGPGITLGPAADSKPPPSPSGSKARAGSALWGRLRKTVDNQYSDRLLGIIEAMRKRRAEGPPPDEMSEEEVAAEKAREEEESMMVQFARMLDDVFQKTKGKNISEAEGKKLDNMQLQMRTLMDSFESTYAQETPRNKLQRDRMRGKSMSSKRKVPTETVTSTKMHQKWEQRREEIQQQRMNLLSQVMHFVDEPAGASLPEIGNVGSEDTRSAPAAASINRERERELKQRASVNSNVPEYHKGLQNKLGPRGAAAGARAAARLSVMAGLQKMAFVLPPSAAAAASQADTPKHQEPDSQVESQAAPVPEETARTMRVSLRDSLSSRAGLGARGQAKEERLSVNAGPGPAPEPAEVKQRSQARLAELLAKTPRVPGMAGDPRLRQLSRTRHEATSRGINGGSRASALDLDVKGASRSHSLATRGPSPRASVAVTEQPEQSEPLKLPSLAVGDGDLNARRVTDPFLGDAPLPEISPLDTPGRDEPDVGDVIRTAAERMLDEELRSPHLDIIGVTSGHADHLDDLLRGRMDPGQSELQQILRGGVSADEAASALSRASSLRASSPGRLRAVLRATQGATRAQKLVGALRVETPEVGFPSLLRQSSYHKDTGQSKATEQQQRLSPLKNPK